MRLRVRSLNRFLILAGLVAGSLAVAIPALADFTGPDRRISTWSWERLVCDYQAVYDPPGPGWYGCSLTLYEPPDGRCQGNVNDYFTSSACGWPAGINCSSVNCDVSRSSSVDGCNEGQPGCRAVERIVDQPPATISGSIACDTPGSGGWCRGGAILSLSGSEPLSGYAILALEGTENGTTFACSGAACDVPLSEGGNDFSFWAVSSYGDTSEKGSASGSLDSQDPSLSGSVSGTSGDNGWYVSGVTVSASASDAAPGSGLASLDVKVDGGGWSGYSGPVSLGDGSHNVELGATDGAGNSDTQSLSIDVDTQAPFVDLDAVPSFCPGCGEAIGITLVVQDGVSGIASWSLQAEGTVVASGGSATGSTITWDGGGLGGGRHTLRLEGRDAAGNTAEAEFDFNLIVPTVAPKPSGGDGDNNTVVSPFSLIAPTPTLRASSTPVGSAAPPTQSPQPTRTPVTVAFGAVPALPAGPSAGDASIPDSVSRPPISPSPAIPGAPSGVLYGAVATALIAGAMAIGLEEKRRREAETARMRAAMAAANARAEAAEKSRFAALAAAKEQAEFDLAMGEIVNQATGGTSPSPAWLAAAAAAAVEAARRAKQARDDERLARKEAMLEPRIPPPPPVDLAKWKQQDYIAGEAWEGRTASPSEARQEPLRDTLIGPIFSDPKADFNSFLSTDLTIGRAPFSYDSGSPVDPKVDLGGDSAAVWAFALIGVIIKQVLTPIANNLALKRRQPNVTVQLYYSLYGNNGIRVPGLVIDNHSQEPIWVDGVILSNGGRNIVQVATENGIIPSPRLLPPVIQPGSSGTIYLRPADIAETFPISPRIEASVQLRAVDFPQVVKFQVSSLEALLGALP